MKQSIKFLQRQWLHFHFYEVLIPAFGRPNRVGFAQKKCENPKDEQRLPLIKNDGLMEKKADLLRNKKMQADLISYKGYAQ